VQTLLLVTTQLSLQCNKFDKNYAKIVSFMNFMKTEIDTKTTVYKILIKTEPSI